MKAGEMVLATENVAAEETRLAKDAAEQEVGQPSGSEGSTVSEASRSWDGGKEGEQPCHWCWCRLSRL